MCLISSSSRRRRSHITWEGANQAPPARFRHRKAKVNNAKVSLAEPSANLEADDKPPHAYNSVMGGKRGFELIIKGAMCARPQRHQHLSPTPTAGSKEHSLHTASLYYHLITVDFEVCLCCLQTSHTVVSD